MGPGDDGQSFLVEFVIEVLARAVEKSKAFVKTAVTGKQVMIVGQARAGKTTFLDYLQYGLFEAEKPTQKTHASAETPHFMVDVGRDHRLELCVKKATDTSGQVGPVANADEVAARRPHAVLVFLDVTTSLAGKSERSTVGWLRAFCKRLEAQARVTPKKVQRLKSLIVVLNKADKADSARMDKYTRAIEKVLDQELRDARGKMIDEIVIVPCISVTNPEGTGPLDRLISLLAKALVK